MQDFVSKIVVLRFTFTAESFLAMSCINIQKKLDEEPRIYQIYVIKFDSTLEEYQSILMRMQSQSRSKQFVCT